MSDRYVYAKEAKKRLDLAKSVGSSVYVYGATGYGKTRLITEYTNDENVIFFSPAMENWETSDIFPTAENPVTVVIDNLQQLNNENKEKAIISLIERENVRVILSGRMATPKWLYPLIPDGKLLIISEDKLRLKAPEIKEIALNEGLTISDELAAQFEESAQGNAFIISSIINMMKAGEEFGPDLSETIKTSFVTHIEKEIIPEWSSAMQEFLMQLSVVDNFTLPLAIMITGDDRACDMIDRAMEIGNFISLSNDTYTMRPLLVQALRQRALKVFGLQKYNECLNRAGLYYETKNDLISALHLYEESGNTSRIRSLLIRNGRRHFGEAQFYELKKYYLELPEKDAESTPVLMSSLSMLYSVLMNAEMSEYWYSKLKEHSKTATGGEKRETNELLVYLDIALPHRGSVDVLSVAMRAASLIAGGGFTLPEFCITSNLPSVMSGGKDFSAWSKRDQFLADTAGKALTTVLGPVGRGIVHAALCESFYEKGGRDSEVLHHAMLLQMENEGGGKLDLLFVAVGIQIRLSMLVGNISNAYELLAAFREKVKAENRTAMLKNIDALEVRLDLITGNREKPSEWIEKSPNELVEFWAPDRYLYQTKILCYIDRGENEKAVSLLEKLKFYADTMNRPYMNIEINLLLAVANKRLGRSWENLFTEAVKEAEEYKFMRVISEKGAGVLPLLKKVKKDYIEGGGNREYFLTLLDECESVAKKYPAFLSADAPLLEDFSESQLEILRLQADGFSMKQIAEKLDISERTAKYHAAENYRKLDAQGKTDAVQKAKSLKLI